jgi:hypothetical protein
MWRPQPLSGAGLLDVGDLALSWSHPDVCFNEKYQARRAPDQPLNCGQCSKCARTVLTLGHFGLLERYAEPFNLEDRDALIGLDAGNGGRFGVNEPPRRPRRPRSYIRKWCRRRW